MITKGHLALLTLHVRIYVSGFSKTWHNDARTKIQFIAQHKSHTLALSRHTNDGATDSQVCFHRQHFIDPVNSWRSTTGCTVPLGSTNKATWCITLLPTTILTQHVDCDCLCALLMTQQLCSCFNGWYNLPLALNPPTPIFTESMILVFRKYHTG